MQPVQVAEPLKAPVEEQKSDAVTVPEINDSSAGLQRMYADLEPLAARLRSACVTLLFFSILFCGSLEGMLGFVAATGVLCCAAPGSLGTAYAARCTRVMALMCAVLAFVHMMCLSTFAFAVLPEMPHALKHACMEQAKAVEAPRPSGIIMEQQAIIVSGIAADETNPDAELAVPTSSAHFFATVVVGGARRLQEMAPVVLEHPEPCARAERAFTQVAPFLLFAAVLVQLGLFFSAMSVAQHAGRLVLAARRFGANAI